MATFKLGKWYEVRATLEANEIQNIERAASILEKVIGFLVLMFALSFCVKIYDEKTYSNCLNMGFGHDFCIKEGQRALERNRR